MKTLTPANQLSPQPEAPTTPGILVAELLQGLPELRLIAEILDAEGSTVVVVVRQDDEPVMDRIFDAMQRIYRLLPGIRFDLRVRCQPEPWDLTPLRNSSTVRFG